MDVNLISDLYFLYEVLPTIRAKHKEKNREKKVGEDGNKCSRCKFNCSVLAKTNKNNIMLESTNKWWHNIHFGQS